MLHTHFILNNIFSDSDDEKTVTRAILASLLGLSITINIVFVIIAGYKIQKKKCPPLQGIETVNQANLSISWGREVYCYKQK